MPDEKLIDETHVIADKRGNGKLRREVWTNSKTGKVTRYNLAYINHAVFAGDHGRVLGYDNAHDGHHRHWCGRVEAVGFVSFEDTEARFEQGYAMKQLTLKTSTEKEFFSRGQTIAKVADTGGDLSASKLISFEDAADLVKLMSAARLALLRTVKEAPGSITEIAQRLQRDRSAVTRDVAQLQSAGLLSVQEQPLAGHGRMKFVRATAQRFRLQAEVA